MAGAACGKTLRLEKFLEIGGCEDLHGQIMLGSWSDSWQAQCLVNLGRCWTATFRRRRNIWRSCSITFHGSVIFGEAVTMLECCFCGWQKMW